MGMLGFAGFNVKDIIRDLDILGLGNWSESSLKKGQLRELADLRERYLAKELTKAEYKMMANDVLKVSKK